MGFYLFFISYSLVDTFQVCHGFDAYVEAGLREPFEIMNGEWLIKRIPSLLSINSKRFLEFLIRYIEDGYHPQTHDEQLMLNMFFYTFYRTAPKKGGFTSIETGIQFILSSKAFKEEILDILKYNRGHIDFVPKLNPVPYPCPLEVHCRYTTDQILAAFGYWNAEKAPTFREGVLYLREKATDIFFITLNKSEKDFSPSTLYEDYALNERLFHWQTQSRTSDTSSTAQRYIHHREQGTRIVLFVREFKTENGIASPFVYLGEVEYLRHEGSKPTSFIWRLKDEMPASLVPIAMKGIL